MQIAINGMQHTASTVMVFQCDDYNKFNMIKGNRDLDMKKIKKILADVERGTNLLKYCPVLVVEKNNKLDIIDGQHRCVVAKKLKSAVYDIMAEDLSLYDIARMNSNTEKWKAHDFVNCYVQLGNENYAKLDALLKKYPGVPITTATVLLSRGNPINTGHTQLLEKFHRGEFVVEYEEKAEEFLNAIMQFDYQYKLNREFLVAIHRVVESDIFPINELIEKTNAASDQLRKHDHWRKYLSNLEEIVNKGKSKRVAIYQ